MGIDLRLLPLDALRPGSGRLFGFSHTVLNVPRPCGLYEELRLLPLEDLPFGHSIMSLIGHRISDGPMRGAKTYGVLSTDAYAAKYQWCAAGSLAETLGKFLPDNPTTKYIAALAPDTKVILDWH